MDMPTKSELQELVKIHEERTEKERADRYRRENEEQERILAQIKANLPSALVAAASRGDHRIDVDCHTLWPGRRAQLADFIRYHGLTATASSDGFYIYWGR